MLPGLVVTLFPLVIVIAWKRLPRSFGFRLSTTALPTPVASTATLVRPTQRLGVHLGCDPVADLVVDRAERETLQEDKPQQGLADELELEQRDRGRVGDLAEVDAEHVPGDRGFRGGLACG